MQSYKPWGTDLKTTSCLHNIKKKASGLLQRRVSFSAKEFSFGTKKRKINLRRSQPVLVSWGFILLCPFHNPNLKGPPHPTAHSLVLKPRALTFGSRMSLGDRCERRCCHTGYAGAGGGLWRALVGPQENFVLGGHILSPALLVSQEFLETGCCKGESLPTKAH